jgi:hypothetical protein
MYRLRLDQVFEVFSGTKEDFRYLVECAAEVVIVFELDGGKRGFANGCDPGKLFAISSRIKAARASATPIRTASARSTPPPRSHSR